MLHIKRLYTFMYQTFLPVFAMTFGICLFIFIIQFLWQHIEKLVGKGLETSVLLELFFYATLNLIPMVLPLAILLASLMTFGNMGERLELLAIKASGVSLLKIMSPLIILVAAISIGCFFFQNELAPKFRVKVASLFYSIKQKSPELAIPEGAFYNDLPNYSIYVKKKNLETHMLHGVIIYSTTSGGFKNMSVDVCDSAIMKVADSKDYLYITMFDGERFENLKDQPGKTQTSAGTSEFVPYMRENFKRKEVIIPFNDDFQRTDEARFDDTQISKNLSQLQTSIDSMGMRIDTLNRKDRNTIANQSFLYHRKSYPITKVDTSQIKEVPKPLIPPVTSKTLDIDSVFYSYAQNKQTAIMSTALSQARSASGNHLSYFHMDTPKPRLQRDMRMHEIYWHRMFTLPFACFVFFFIGAPLGSIIRKGGLGVPVIISVLLFIIYYIVDNIGYKMARDGVWQVWQGAWLSAAVLFPLGVFLTYKSMNESDLFNTELYGRYLRKLLLIKDVSIKEQPQSEQQVAIPSPEELSIDTKLIEDYRNLDNEGLKDMVRNYYTYSLDIDTRNLALSVLYERGEDVGRLIGAETLEIKEAWFDYFNRSSYLTMAGYVLALAFLIGNWFLITNIIELSYIFLYLRSLTFYISYYAETEAARKNKKFYTYHTIVSILAFVAYPIMYFYMKNRMIKDMQKMINTSFTIVRKY